MAEIKELALQLFEGAEVRVYGTPQAPLFVADDVGTLLGFANIRTTIKDYDNTMRTTGTVDTAGGPQRATLLTELGLFELVFRSTKPAAKRFKARMIAMLKQSTPTDRQNMPTIADDASAPNTVPDKVPLEDIIIPVVTLPRRTQITYSALFDVTCYRRCPCVYLFHIHDNDYKYGISQDIERRAKEHAAHFGSITQHQITLVGAWKCDSVAVASEVESRIKTLTMTRGMRCVKYGKTEMLTSNNIDALSQIIDEYVLEGNNGHRRAHMSPEDSVDIHKMELSIRMQELKNEEIGLKMQSRAARHHMREYHL